MVSNVVGKELMDVKESLLIANSQNGDKEAFTELVSLYQERVYNLAYQIVHNHADAEDIAQETFIRLYRKIHKFRGGSTFFTWLYRITVNAAKNFLRAKPVNHVPFEDTVINPNLLAEGNNPSTETISKETDRTIAKAIDMLPFEQRTAVILHDIEGVSHKEISEIMHCSEGTVWSRLFYARKKLRVELSNLL